MFSVVNPSIVYDVSPDAVETDIDVISDLWTMGGHDVYRGARDPRYTHANVFWLYNKDLERVGCAEHRKENNADVSLLWFHESPFATLFQEDEWTSGDTLWSVLPEHTYERFLVNGWTNPMSFLDKCLQSTTRIVSPSMIVNRPTMYVCTTCNTKTLMPGHGTPYPLDYPDMKKVVFVDESMNLQSPPKDSRVYAYLRQEQPVTSSSLDPALEVQSRHL
jgi:hypothetical protein